MPPMQLQPAFDLLGVSPDSDPATIRRAWRALVRSYHPDLAKSDPKNANRLVMMAEQAFQAARAVCSMNIPASRLSAYL